jgi:hypothetical protein
MRKPKSVFVNIQGTSNEFEILNVCEFNSTRKRMSTVVRMPNGKIKLFCKGADTVILERVSKNQPYAEKTILHLEVRVRSELTFGSHHYIRTTLPMVSERYVSPFVTFLRLSIVNGLLFMIKPPPRSMAEGKHLTKLRS